MTHCTYPGFSNKGGHKHQPIRRRRVELAPGVYAFIGYGSSNFAAITSNNGYILIDTGDGLDATQEAVQEIAQLAPGALQAIILTHSHPDHRGGAASFMGGRQVPVWAHSDFGVELKHGKGLEKVGAARGGKQFGVGIADEDYTPNSILPRFPDSTPGPLAQPNHFVSDDKEVLTIDGVTLELYKIPGESPDTVVVWLPEQKTLFTGDNVFYSFPNLYPIRGGIYRDVELWAKGVRRLIDFAPEAIMFGHLEALVGDEIIPLLGNYAEAMEYVYNATINGMNEGKTPDELAATIELPVHLQSLPYLGEYYGAIAWAVREIFAAKLGWFDGNPSKLVPLSPLEEAQRIARLAGGTPNLHNAAQAALQTKDYRWAAQLADYLLQLGQTETGRAIKAEALEALSKIILPMAGKNYLQRSAQDLRAE